MPQMRAGNAAHARDYVAHLLRISRGRKGLMQQDVADSVGVTLRTYQRWESAENAPYVIHLSLLADALDLDYSELLRASRGHRPRTLSDTATARESVRELPVDGDDPDAATIVLDEHGVLGYVEKEIADRLGRDEADDDYVEYDPRELNRRRRRGRRAKLWDIRAESPRGTLYGTVEAPTAADALIELPKHCQFAEDALLVARGLASATRIVVEEVDP